MTTRKKGLLGLAFALQMRAAADIDAHLRCVERVATDAAEDTMGSARGCSLALETRTMGSWPAWL